MENMSWRYFTRFCLMLASFLLLAAGLVWQPRFTDRGKDITPPIETASPFAPHPTITHEALVGVSATQLPRVGSIPSPTPPPSRFPLWVTVLRDVRLIGGLQRLDEKIPQGTTLRALGNNDDHMLVYYAGDGIDRKATEGLVAIADVVTAKAPKWVMARRVTNLRPAPDLESPTVTWLQRGTVSETLDDGNHLLRIFNPGNGRERGAVEGWVSVENVVAAGPTLAAERRGMRWLDKARIGSLRSGDGVWLMVPYRTQLDGSRPAAANCGPASIGMALEYFNVPATNAELRTVAHRLQGTSGADTGFAIEHLQRTVELLGMKGFDLYSGKELKKWSLDDLRSHIMRGHPVVPQLRFRTMPGRSHSDYWEDHYVVICGVQGNDFIFNDPVDTEGPGHGRLISAKELEEAWSTSHFPFAAFAVGWKD